MKRPISFVTALLLSLSLLCLCGCNVELPEVSEPTPTRTALVLLDIDIASLLTKAEMESAVGFSLRDPQVSNEGRMLVAISEGGTASLSISVEQSTLDKFRDALPKVESDDLEPAPNLAEEAWWLSSGHTLFLFSRGYTVSINISDRDADEESLLLASRGLASLICDRLPMK